MRNEAPVIQLAEWAAQVNAETCTCMGVSVVPAECQEAHTYLDGLMTDEEALARVAADLLAVKNLTAGTAESANNDDAAVPNGTADDDYVGLSSSFAAACRAADEKEGRKPVEPAIARARRLMADDVTLERAYAEVSKPSGVAASTLMAAEYLVRENDPERLRAWLAKHTDNDCAAILSHIERKTAP